MIEPSNAIKFTEKMISASELIIRWPGLKLTRLVQLIDERIVTDEKSDVTPDFPEPFYLLGIRYRTTKGNKADKAVYRCQRCSIDGDDRPSNWKPYKMRVKDGKKQYYLKRVVFKENDIVDYECTHKYILYDHEELNQIIQNQENLTDIKQRLPILQKDAALLCEVSPSTIRNWDKGIHQPLGYPGRYDISTFILWAKTYKSTKIFVREAKAVGRAIPIDPATIENFHAYGVFQNEASEFDDD